MGSMSILDAAEMLRLRADLAMWKHAAEEGVREVDRLQARIDAALALCDRAAIPEMLHPTDVRAALTGGTP